MTLQRLPLVGLLLAIGLAGLVPLPSAAQGDEFDIYLAAAIRLYENLEYERALQQLERARSKSRGIPDDVKVSLYEGIIYMEMGELEQARASFKAGLLLDVEAKLPVAVSPKIQKDFDQIRGEARKELAPILARRRAEEEARKKAEAEAAAQAAADAEIREKAEAAAAEKARAEAAAEEEARLAAEQQARQEAEHRAAEAEALAEAERRTAEAEKRAAAAEAEARAAEAEKEKALALKKAEEAAARAEAAEKAHAEAKKKADADPKRPDQSLSAEEREKELARARAAEADAAAAARRAEVEADAAANERESARKAAAEAEAAAHAARKNAAEAGANGGNPAFDPDATAPDAPKAESSSVWPWILGGVALAAGGTGGFFGYQTKGHIDSAKSAEFQTDAANSLEDAKGTAFLANVLYGTAGAFGLGAMISLAFDSPPPPPTPTGETTP